MSEQGAGKLSPRLAVNYDLRCDGNIGRAVRGEKIGTLITSDA